MLEAGTRFVAATQRVAANVAAAPEAFRRCSTCGAQYPVDFIVCPKDATTLERPEAADGDPLIGEVLAGTFCVTGLIGAGGMGNVYEAEHVRLPKRFAMKVMHEDLLKHPDALARFEREAQAVARVSSEHVIEIVDVVRLKDGRPCIVSELLEGQELGELLDHKGTAPLAEAIAICRQVCRGLAAAHAASVVHRDLKPSNLFLVSRSDGRPFVKILDFGVAKLSDGADLTRTGMVVGTPAYMAPEQARGSADVDERADVYSVGAVLYRLLTGAPPFSGDEPAVVITRLLTEDPIRPRDLVRSIPEGVEHVIQRAMARSREERPRTALDLERELAACDVASAQSTVFDDEAPRARGVAPTMATLAVESPSTSRGSEDVAQRSRWSRAGASSLAIATGLVFGAAALATAATAIRAFAGRSKLNQTELILLGVIAAIVTLLTLLSATRALISRWRSGPAIDRLAAGLSATLFATLGTAGVFAIAWTSATTIGPVAPPELMPFLDLGKVLAPTLVGFVVFVRALRRAAKVL